MQLRQYARAKRYLQQCLYFAELSDKMRYSYSLQASLNLARIAHIEGQYQDAQSRCKQVKKLAKRSQKAYGDAKALLKWMKKEAHKRT